MATIVTRSGKGSPLTNTEVDANFTNLNTDKAELSGATFTGEIVAPSLDISGNIDVDGTTNLDVVDIDGAVDMASTLQVDGVATFTSTPVFSSDITVNDDIFLTTDSAAIKFGNGQEVTLTHTNDVGLTLNSSNRFMFRDSAIYLSSTQDGQLTVVADTEIELNATTIDINGNILASGTLGVTGVLTANAGVVVDNFTLDGTTLALSSGSMTLDSAAQIILDGADDGAVQLRDDGTKYADIYSTSGDFYIKSTQSDKDIKFQGNDGGVGFTALTLDMSAAGAATFTGAITANAGVVVDNITIDGQEIDVSSGDLTLDVAGNISLDADGGQIKLFDGGTQFGLIYKNSNDLEIYSHIQDGDIKLRGNDGGSGIVALSLDMSASGFATFNTGLYAQDSSFSGSITPLIIRATNSTASALWGMVSLYRNISAVGSGAGIAIGGETANGSEAEYVYIGQVIEDNTNSAQYGAAVIAPTYSGTRTERLRVGSLGGVTTKPVASGHTVFNENGVDADFRVESNGNTHMLFVDGGNNRVGIGTSSIDSNAKLQIEDSTNPNINIDRTSSLLTGNHLGYINFQNNGAVYGYMGAWVESASGTDGKLAFGTRNGTSVVDRLTIASTGAATFSSSVQATGLKVDAATPVIEIDSSTSTELATLQFTTDGTVDSKITHVAQTGAMIIDSGRNTSWGGSLALITDEKQNAIFTRTGVVFNDGGADMDFRVESTNDANALFVRGSDGYIGMGAGASPIQPLTIGASSGSNLNYYSGTSNVISSGSGIKVSKAIPNDASAGSGLNLSNTSSTNGTMSPMLHFSALSASTTYSTTYAGIWGRKRSSGTDTNWNAGSIEFGTSHSAGISKRMELNYLGGLITTPLGGGHTVFNEDSADADFRVESNGNANMLFVDAGSETVCIGHNATSPTVPNIVFDARNMVQVGQSFYQGIVANTGNDNTGFISLFNLTTAASNNVGCLFDGTLIVQSYTGFSRVRFTASRYFTNSAIAFSVADIQDGSGSAGGINLSLVTATVSGESFLGVQKISGGTGTSYINAFVGGTVDIREIASGSYTVTATHGTLIT